MKTKFKMIYAIDPDELNKEVNDFIKYNNVKVKNIQGECIVFQDNIFLHAYITYEEVTE